MPLCNYPDCANMVKDTSVTGVCKDHTHKTPYCKCRRCMGMAFRRTLETYGEIAEKGDLPSQKRSKQWVLRHKLARAATLTEKKGVTLAPFPEHLIEKDK